MLLKGGSDFTNKLIENYHKNKKIELERGGVANLVPNRFLYDKDFNPINDYYKHGKDSGIKSIVEESHKKGKEDQEGKSQIDSDMQHIKNEIDTRKGVEAYISQVCIDAKKDHQSIESKAIFATLQGSNVEIKEMIAKKFPDVDVKSSIIDDIIKSKNKEIDSTKKEIDSQIKESQKEPNEWGIKHYLMFAFAILISMICPIAGVVIFLKLPPVNKDDVLYQKIKSLNPSAVDSMEKKSEELKSKPWGNELIENVYSRKDDIIKNKDNKEELDKIINEAKKPIIENMKKGGKSDSEIENTSKEMDDFIKKINIKNSIDSRNIDEFKSSINEAKEQELNLQYKNDPNKDAKVKEEMEKFHNEIEGVTSNFGKQKHPPISSVSGKKESPQIASQHQKTQEPEIGSKTEEYLKRRNEEKKSVTSNTVT